jgi:hypothetical protein
MAKFKFRNVCLHIWQNSLILRSSVTPNFSFIDQITTIHTSPKCPFLKVYCLVIHFDVLNSIRKVQTTDSSPNQQCQWHRCLYQNLANSIKVPIVLPSGSSTVVDYSPHHSRSRASPAMLLVPWMRKWPNISFEMSVYTFVKTIWFCVPVSIQILVL